MKSKEELEKIKIEIEDAIKNGAKVIDLDFFNSLRNIKISNSNIIQARYTIYEYKSLIEELKKLNPIDSNKFLVELKNEALLDIQTLDSENPSLVNSNNSSNEYNSIDELINIYDNMSKEEFIRVHDLFLEKTKSQEKIGLRTDDTKYVGSNVDGNRKISYFPLYSDKIDTALNMFLDYHKDTQDSLENDYDALIIPILKHGIISSLQMFNDGNTRYARIFQTIDTWKLLNKELDEKVDLPILYTSRQYYPYKDEYRNKIKDLVVINDTDAWNNWISFNLKRLQDKIYDTQNKLENIKIVKHIK